MKKLSIDQWMGIVIAFMGALVLTLAAVDVGHGWGGVAPVTHGKPMPALEGHTLAGGVVNLPAGDTKGKVVLLDFWATWCPPCRAEIPKLADLNERYRSQGLEFWAVNTDQTSSRASQAKLVQDFLAQRKLKMPVILDDGLLGNRYKIDSLPTMYLVGRNGRIRKVYVGLTSESTIEHDLKAALAEKAPAAS